MSGRTVFIGAGFMGGGLLLGALEEGVLSAERVFVVEHSEARASELASRFDVAVGTEMPELIESDTVILAVKPQALPEVLPQLRDFSGAVISIAAGISVETLRSSVPGARLYRAMPNLPATIGAGFTALVMPEEADTETDEHVRSIFDAVGETAVVSEADLDRLCALSGSGPGFVFVIMDALADAGVRIGLPRALAIRAAAHTIFGAGRMAAETGVHPAVLRDGVTSPGGTTIAGIDALEAHGLRSAMYAGVKAAYERNEEIAKGTGFREMNRSEG